MMSAKKTLWLVGGAALLVIIFAALYFVNFSRKEATRQNEENKQAQEQKITQDLTKSAEAVTESTKVEVPSVNPLNAAVPDVNPIEKVNPFKDVYENPFE